MTKAGFCQGGRQTRAGVALSDDTDTDFGAVRSHLGFLFEAHEAEYKEHDSHDSYNQVDDPHNVLLLQENRATKKPNTLILAGVPAIYNI